MTLKALLLALSVFFGAFSPLSAQEAARIYSKSEFAPTAFHEAIYRMMEACSGITGNYERIRWYVAQIILVGDPNEGRQWAGAWSMIPESDLAQIILEREHVFNGNTVSHEALHDLYDGQAPMDTAHKCVLDWSRLTYVRRGEN